jgi:thiosulfate/3-mercaptopyruvate sulfurtransferase
MNESPLISAASLSRLIESSDCLVVDCRKDLGTPESGRLAHAAAHIPGAVYADLDTDLSDLTRIRLGRHPLPDQRAFSQTLSRWGWQPGQPVIAYDDAGGALAASRLWWMLRLVGAYECCVLDGGYSAWIAGGFDVSSEIPTRESAHVEVTYDPEQCVEYDALQSGLAGGSLRLLDARAAARYRGDVEPLDRVAGHVPGALNRPYSDNLDDDGRFKAAPRLAAEFEPLIAPFAPDSVVHMCGSGVTACHNLLAMEQAGLRGSRLFAPSWSGWLSDPARPVRSGAVP